MRDLAFSEDHVQLIVSVITLCCPGWRGMIGPNVPMPVGFLYLIAIMDWFSRYVVTWELSNSLEGSFCCTALDRALQLGTPTIFNTDQGSQFTAQSFTRRLVEADVQISMDGRGRVFDIVIGN